MVQTRFYYWAWKIFQATCIFSHVYSYLSKVLNRSFFKASWTMEKILFFSKVNMLALV